MNGNSENICTQLKMRTSYLLDMKRNRFEKYSIGERGIIEKNFNFHISFIQKELLTNHFQKSTNLAVPKLYQFIPTLFYLAA
jgi:hypothetical protein